MQFPKILEEHFETVRAQDRKLCTECGLSYEDPFADVKVHTGNDAKRHSPTATVVVTYDGRGYEHLSYQRMTQGEIAVELAAEFGGEPLPPKGPDFRQRLDKALADAGGTVEDLNNWSFAIYKE